MSQNHSLMAIPLDSCKSAVQTQSSGTEKTSSGQIGKTTSWQTCMGGVLGKPSTCSIGAQKSPRPLVVSYCLEKCHRITVWVVLHKRIDYCAQCLSIESLLALNQMSNAYISDYYMRDTQWMLDLISIHSKHFYLSRLGFYTQISSNQLSKNNK